MSHCICLLLKSFETPNQVKLQLFSLCFIVVESIKFLLLLPSIPIPLGHLRRSLAPFPFNVRPGQLLILINLSSVSCPPPPSPSTPQTPQLMI